MIDHVVLQFSTSTAWQSAVIRKMCHSPFSHVDLVLPDGNLLGASDQGAGSPCVEGNPQGVAIRPPDYQEFGIRRQATIVTDRAPLIVANARSQLGKAFDSGAITAFFGDEPRRDWRVDECWFCAELFAWDFEVSGYWGGPLLWPKDRVSPTDLLFFFMFDPNFVNRDTFWNPILGLALGRHER